MSRHKDVVDLTLFIMTSFERHVAETLAASFFIFLLVLRSFLLSLLFAVNRPLELDEHSVGLFYIAGL